MGKHLSNTCDVHGDDCPDNVIRATTSHPSGFRWLLVAENAAYDFEFCPWCGTRFQDADGQGNGSRRLQLIAWPVSTTVCMHPAEKTMFLNAPGKLCVCLDCGSSFAGMGG